MSYGKRVQKTYATTGHKMSAVAAALPIYQINQGELTQKLRGALVLAFSRERHPVKRLAEVADTNVATAKNWLEGRSTPQALQLLRLMATVPEFQAEVRKLTAMEADMDPEFARDFQKLATAFQARRA